MSREIKVRAWDKEYKHTQNFDSHLTQDQISMLKHILIGGLIIYDEAAADREELDYDDAVNKVEELLNELEEEK